MSQVPNRPDQYVFTPGDPGKIQNGKPEGAFAKGFKVTAGVIFAFVAMFFFFILFLGACGAVLTSGS